MNLTKHFKQFIHSESSGGIVLIAATILTVLSANFIFHEQFGLFWHSNFLGKSLDFWVNDVLMSIFFLMVGLEIEREIYIGELSKIKQAMLPIIAALGGMLVPALIYIIINYSTGNIHGFGIPMATDIAFSLTVLTLLGKRIPISLKVFLTALAIIDDLGAIVVIALFYTSNFSFYYLALAMALLGLMFIFNRKGIKNLLFYFIPGIAMWIFVYKAGIHPTIAAVLLAFVIPFGNGDEHSPSYKLQLKLHTPVAFFVLPIFAIANTGIILHAESFAALFSQNGLGILLGLIIGKPIGILLFSYAAIKLNISQLFENMQFKHILGAGMVAGIGFTMSIFISILAFDSAELIDISKLSVFVASIISAFAGYLFLIFTNPKREIEV